MTDPLLARIENLERQNRRMKGTVFALGLCMGALLTLGLVSPQKTAGSVDKIEAREILLSDGIRSAKLTPGSLVFSAKSGQETEKATMTASAISLGGRYSTEIRPEGMICSREGVPRFDLVVREIGASIAFKNGAGLMGSMLDESILVMMNDEGLLSLRPEHVFVQKGDSDTLLTSTSLKTRDSEKYKERKTK